MQNITDLRDELKLVFQSIKKDEVDLARAKEMVNTAGKILDSCKIELTYNQIRKYDRKVNFLEAKK